LNIILIYILELVVITRYRISKRDYILFNIFFLSIIYFISKLPTKVSYLLILSIIVYRLL